MWGTVSPNLLEFFCRIDREEVAVTREDEHHDPSGGGQEEGVSFKSGKWKKHNRTGLFKLVS